LKDIFTVGTFETGGAVGFDGDDICRHCVLITVPAIVTVDISCDAVTTEGTLAGETAIHFLRKETAATLTLNCENIWFLRSERVHANSF
jgi:hypothetical protein